MVHPAVKNMSMEHIDWFGTLPSHLYGQYLDSGLLLILGGVPWQVYFQRVLATKSASIARTISFVAAVCCIIMAVPPMIFGAVARATGQSSFDFLPFSSPSSFRFFSVIEKKMFPHYS